MERTAEVVIEQPINAVWEVVTDSQNFIDFTQGRWSWTPFDREKAMAGTVFKRRIAREEENYKVHEEDYYIVNWEPPYRFSMGGNPDTWDYDFSLAELGEKTKVRVTMRLNLLGWLPPYQGIVEKTADELKGRCERK
ncbi:MAG TPA: SRPBCC domain-containing protein [Pyrinomonadaceae bacterium]